MNEQWAKTCSRHGPYGGPACPKCQHEANCLMSRMMEGVAMKAPAQEQLNDPAWWDENAGTASHYCPTNKQFYDSRLHPCCFTRPTKPAAPEWGGEGLPPVGSKVVLRGKEKAASGRSGFSPGHDNAGEEVKIYCHFTDDTGVELAAYVGTNKRIGGVACARAFKPIRTKEQREREELVEVLTNFFFDDVSETLKPEDIADAIIAAGWPKGGES